MCPAEKNWWKTYTFRQYIARKIQDAILDRDAPYVENAAEMEKRIFRRSKNKDNYFSLVMHLLKRIRRKGAKQQEMTVLTDHRPFTLEDMDDSKLDINDENETTAEELSDLKDLSYQLWSMSTDSQGMFSIPSCSYQTHNFIM
ncbi:unnamed protein product [Allacma fusca]|uniref:Mediator of RNA polymerase II transcription subunit 15 n=1 Tax=Allacma fusca TaxID=39272 RepID=A0A8J2M8J1_9HEXA|nr:unnamed protein product [Allacma fusca]